ncbi:MAG: class I SAM-dependent DNA methyltransferase [Gemmobacter sp.]
MHDPAELDTAYALRTPEDNRRYYADWALRYDADFATAMAYRQPSLVAQAFVAAGGQGPVLDVGAGTGLLGVALAAQGVGPIDGIDISPEMLAVARTKGCYRHLTVADLTADLPPLATPFAGVVSSGTFTHGHLGPEVLLPLIAIAAPGAVFALSIHQGVWQARGFAAALDTLAPRIDGLTATDAAIYASDAAGDHAADRSMIVTFRVRQA